MPPKAVKLVEENHAPEKFSYNIDGYVYWECKCGANSDAGSAHPAVGWSQHLAGILMSYPVQTMEIRIGVLRRVTDGTSENKSPEPQSATPTELDHP